MSNKTNMPFIKKMNLSLVCKTFAVASLSTSILVSNAQAAEQEWWFDVEVILFDRNLKPDEVAETFKQSSLLAESTQSTDLLTAYLTPDLSYIRAGLDFCRDSRLLLEEQKYQEDFAFPEPQLANNGIDAKDLGNQADNTVDQENDIDNGANTEIDEDDATGETFEYQVATNDIFNDQINDKEQEQPQANTNGLTTTQQGIDSQSLITKSDDELTNTNAVAGTIEIEVSDLETADEPIAPPVDLTVNWLEWQIPKQFPCAYAEQIEPSVMTIVIDELNQHPLDDIEETPVKINGVEWQEKRGAFLLPTDALRMNDLYAGLKKQRSIKPLLHAGWRQKVTFGATKAQTYRLFAGKNYGSEFNSLGLRKPLEEPKNIKIINLAEQAYIPAEELANMTHEEHQAWIASTQNNDETTTENTEELFSKIEQALSDDSPVTSEFLESSSNSDDLSLTIEETMPLWQLDGNIKVYLKNVGRVPYLHIDSNLDYRKPVFDPNIAVSDASELLTTDTLTAQLMTSHEQPALTDTLTSPTNFLQSANFNQLRRVISKQVHYFDHPLFGMIVRIHRFKWPKVIKTKDQESETEQVTTN